MLAITANDLKTKGIPIIEDSLNHQNEAIITVRGKPRYVEVKADIAAGRFIQESADDHVRRLLAMP